MAADEARRVIEPWQIVESTWLVRSGFMDVYMARPHLEALRRRP